mgnify:CR=1 FL=1
MMVVVHHLLGTPGIDYLLMPNLGRFGVEIFFVISGFIMWHTTATSIISPAEFWRRRVIRIVPLYWFFLILLIVGALLFPRLFHSTLITPENTIKSFLFIPQFHVVQTGLIAPILIPGWSLNYEMFFYIVFGLAMFLGSRMWRALLLGIGFVGLVALGRLLEPTGAISSTYTNPSLLTFLNGIVLAILYQNGKLEGPRLGSVLLAMCIVLQVSGAISSRIAIVDDFAGFSATAVVGSSVALETIARRTPRLLFLTIGNASYSIYLSHLFFLRLSELTWQHLSLFGSSGMRDATYVLLSLAFSVAGGICVHYLVERPITFNRGRGRSATPAQLA